MICVFALQWGAGRLDPVRHPDTKSYEWSLPSERTATELLSHYRTVGYPFFLRGLGALHLGWGSIPSAQLIVYLASVLLFWSGATAWWGRPWLAFAAASPLFWLDLFELAPLVQPDFLSCGLAIAVVALLFHLLRRPRSGWLWAALTVTVFATYQVRPATVFLIGWVPLLGGVLCRLRPGMTWRTAALRAATLASATVLPWLAFSLFRLALVGHFGLVAFGGYNASAVASCFVDPDILSELPEPYAHLARRVYQRRRARGWQPLELGGDTTACFEQYSDNLWRISSASVWDSLRSHRRRVRSGRMPASGLPDEADRIVVNRRLSSFARAVLVRRPRLYLQWIRDAARYGLAQLPGEAWILWTTLLIPPSLAAAWFTGRHRREPRRRLALDREALSGLWFLGAGHFLLFLALICLVSFPFHRYFLSMDLFLPSALTATLFELWRREVPA